MSVSSPVILLINPPIYDFSAYDLWVKPLGLLYIASILKNAGAQVNLIDCLDRFCCPQTKKSNIWGCGHYNSIEVSKKDCLKNIPRKYKRYGISEEVFDNMLNQIKNVDMVLVTSGMTYWYPGVFEAIRKVKSKFPLIPVVLGGTYATLSYEHASVNSGADYVVKGCNLAALYEIFDKYGLCLKKQFLPVDFSDFPHPCYEIYNFLEYAAIRTTSGCPFECTYCAIKSLSQGVWQRKKPEKIVQEIVQFYKKGINNFAFYDDALFFNADSHVVSILEGIDAYGVKCFFHSPNGLHARYVTAFLAAMLKKTGFIMPRLSLETSHDEKQKVTGGKVSNEQFLSACRYFQEAGYKQGEYMAYIMIGMPEQDFGEIEESVYFAHNAGAKISLPEYSPIPGTKDWGKVKNLLPSDDPLLHNNSIYPLYSIKDRQKFQQLKDLANGLNQRLDGLK